MTALRSHRDDGLLAGSLRASILPIPEVAVVATALVVAGVAMAAGTDRWFAVLVGIALALAGRLGRASDRLDWALPALLRALEYGAIVVLVGDSPWAYALAATLAFRHYDLVYRERIRGDNPPRWLAVVAGGWEVRTVVLAIAAASGHQTRVAAVLALVLAPVIVVEAGASWANRRT